LNFTLTTTLGDIDLLGEIVGGGDYAALEPHTEAITAFGSRFLCLGLDRLIEVQRQLLVVRPADLVGQIVPDGHSRAAAEPP
jgi:hypothetical protein